jgi:hypothetical protein
MPILFTGEDDDRYIRAADLVIPKTIQKFDITGVKDTINSSM